VAEMPEEEFRRRARWLARYFAIYERKPPLTGDSEERAYASWLASIRYRARHGQLPAGRVAILDAEVPDWRTAGQVGTAALEARAAQCRDFHDRTGRWPVASATDETERALGVWRNNMRSATPERQALVEAIAPGWRGRARPPVAKREDAFAERARAAGQFKAERGRWPSKLSGDADEARLGAWWAKTRSVTAPGSPRGAVLDECCPGWGDGPAEREADWADWVQRLVAYRTVHGAWPRAHADGAEERALGRWLTHHRWGRDQLAPERRGLLDEQCPGWDVSSRRLFTDRVAELGSFRTVHDRWPSTTSEDQEETSLAWWHMRQRNRPLTPEQVTALDEAVPGWLDREQEKAPPVAKPFGVRFTTLTADLETFYSAHHRPPHPGGLDPRERSMAVALARYRDNPNASREHRWVLDRCCPGWDRPPTKTNQPAAKARSVAKSRGRKRLPAPERFDVGVTELAAFYGRHLRQPSVSGKPEESRLARWVVAQRTAELTDTEWAQLTAACPGWDVAQGPWRFETFADQCALFVDRHGRWPAMGDIADVPGLVWWCGKLRRVDDPDKVAYLDRVLPGWREAFFA